MKVLATAFSMLVLLSNFVLAAENDLNGTWNGATPRGASIKVVVSDGQTKSYYFKGRSQGVIGGKVQRGTATFGLHTNQSAKVVLTKLKGEQASFVYTDNTGPDTLRVVLSKK